MKHSNVHALVITGFGLNCERETAAAFSHCGASVSQVHLNDLLDGCCKLADFHILAFIGGFSFGDHLGAGTVFANRVKFRLREELEKFVSAGKLIIGICNGFQTLSRLGLVPALDGHYFTQQAALAHNDSGVFRDDWVVVGVNNHSPCVFTRGIEFMHLPVRHGEGKFVAPHEVITKMESQQQVVLRYLGPNGSHS